MVEAPTFTCREYVICTIMGNPCIYKSANRMDAFGIRGDKVVISALHSADKQTHSISKRRFIRHTQSLKPN
jgi:hypothetical protein